MNQETHCLPKHTPSIMEILKQSIALRRQSIEPQDAPTMADAPPREIGKKLEENDALKSAKAVLGDFLHRRNPVASQTTQAQSIAKIDEHSPLNEAREKMGAFFSKRLTAPPAPPPPAPPLPISPPIQTIAREEVAPKRAVIKPTALTMQSVLSSLEQLSPHEKKIYLNRIKDKQTFKRLIFQEKNLDILTQFKQSDYADLHFINEFANQLNFTLITQGLQNEDDFLSLAHLNIHLTRSNKAKLFKSVLSHLSQNQILRQTLENSSHVHAYLKDVIMDLLAKKTTKLKLGQSILQYPETHALLSGAINTSPLSIKREVLPHLNVAQIARAINHNPALARQCFNHLNPNKITKIVDCLDLKCLYTITKMQTFNPIPKDINPLMHEKMITLCLLKFDSATSHALEEIRINLSELLQKSPIYKRLEKTYQTLQHELLSARYHLEENKNLEQFEKGCYQALKKAQHAFEQHKGWHGIPVIVRSILGLLSILLIVPALIIHQHSQGLKSTFFSTPKSKTHHMLDELEQLIQMDASLSMK